MFIHLQSNSDVSPISDKNIKQPDNETEVRHSGVIGFVILKHFILCKTNLEF
jgi:hypothetical protein